MTDYCTFDDATDDPLECKPDKDDVQALLNIGTAMAKALSREKYAEEFLAPSITPPYEYSYRKNDIVPLLRDAYEEISALCGGIAGSLILLPEMEISADIVIVDQYYLSKNEPIFGRHYSVFRRKEEDPNPSVQFGMKKLVNQIENIEQKISHASFYHDTKAIDSEYCKPFTNEVLPKKVIPISTDRFYQIGVCEFLIVDSAIKGEWKNIDEFASREFGKNFEVYLNGKFKNK